MKTFTIFSVVLSAAGALAWVPLKDYRRDRPSNRPYRGVQSSGYRAGRRDMVTLPSLEEFEAGYKLYKAEVTMEGSTDLTPIQVWYGYFNQLIHPMPPMPPSGDSPTTTYTDPTTPTELPEQEESALPTPTNQAGSGRVIDVTVGKDDQLTYEPADILASVGDIVRFHFVSKNHTVTQSSRNDPCNPLADLTGFDSGFQPIEAGSGAEKTFEVTVTQDEKPIWFYCQQFVPAKGLSHCQLGMVGAINADRTGQNSLNAFITRASSSD